MYLLIISQLFVVAVASLFYLNVFINHFSFICSCCNITCFILMYLLLISQLFVVAVVSLFYLNAFIDHFSFICNCSSITVLS